MRWILLTSAILFSCLVSGCAETKPPNVPAAKGTDRSQIVVTSEPLLQMTQTLVGENAATVLVVPAGTSSPDWSPTAADAQTMQDASLILLSGAGYEPWKDRVSLPRSRVRDTAAGYYDQLIRIPDAVTHQHGPTGSHSHPGTVWATWLDPDLCAAQLHQVSLNCVRLLPNQKQTIETAEAKLGAELNSLNSMISAIKTAAKDEALIIYSDAPRYQYLTQRLGWELSYLHWQTSAPLTDANRTELLDLFQSESDAAATENQHRLFLLDSRHSIETESIVRESGCTVIRIDLCESPSSESLSLPKRLKQNLQQILNALTATDDHARTQAP
jgi:zinc transport system substrate-binding protein